MRQEDKATGRGHVWLLVLSTIWPHLSRKALAVTAQWRKQRFTQQKDMFGEQVSICSADVLCCYMVILMLSCQAPALCHILVLWPALRSRFAC